MVQCSGQTYQAADAQGRHRDAKPQLPSHVWKAGPQLRHKVQEFRRDRKEYKKSTSYRHVVAARLHTTMRRWSAASCCLTSLRGIGEARCHDVNYEKHAQSIVDMASRASIRASNWENTVLLLAHLNLQQAPDRLIRQEVGVGIGAEQRWRQALAYFEFLVQFGMRPYQSYYSTTMRSCGKSLRWDWSLELLWNLCRAGIGVDVHLESMQIDGPFEQAAQACRHAGSWSCALSALKILQLARRVSAATSALYVKVMGACCCSRTWTGALTVLEQVSQDGLRPCLRTCTASLVACEIGSRWERSGLLLGSMEKWHLHPVEGTFNPVLEACHSASNWASTLAYLRHMSQSYFVPDARRYASTARALLKNRMIDGALGIIGEMQQFDLDVGVTGPIVFTASMRSFAESVAWRQAIQALGHYFDYGLQADMQLLCAVATACRRADSWSHVLRVLGHAGIEVDITAQNLAISACACVWATEGHEARWQ